MMAIVHRKYSSYCTSNVPGKNFIAARIDSQSDNFELPEWPRIRKQLRKIRIDLLIKNLPNTKKSEPIDKRCLVKLFRAIGNMILPRTITYTRLVRNMHVLLTAGKGTKILTLDLVRHLPEVDPNLASFAHYLAQDIFWEILKAFFYITTSGSTRNELLFFDKCQVMAATTSFFDKLVAGNKLKVLKKAEVHKIIKDIKEAPKLARVYLRPKNSLSSLRMITRKEKDGGNDRLEATRYLLNEISRRLFHCTVDVKGMQVTNYFQKCLFPPNDLVCVVQ